MLALVERVERREHAAEELLVEVQRALLQRHVGVLHIHREELAVQQPLRRPVVDQPVRDPHDPFLRGQLNAGNRHWVPAPRDIVLSILQFVNEASQQTVDGLIRVVQRIVAEIAQTQQAQAAKVRGGVAALEANVAPLVGLAGDQFLAMKGEKEHHLIGLEVAPELQQQRLVLLVLPVIAMCEWHAWRQRRVLQIVDDLQHHVRAEELVEANTRVSTEAAR